MSKAPLLIFGGTGAIGSAMARLAARAKNAPPVHVVTRSGHGVEGTTTHAIGEHTPEALDALAADLPEISGLLITLGTLHGPDHRPEKTFKHLSPEAMAEVYATNTVLPALILSRFLPKLPRDAPAFAAALSARVGSISDNNLGGWVSYRASKAALNQVIRTFAIELKRTHPKARLIGLHPGTVASPLSEPFQGNVPKGKLFSPEKSAAHLWEVIQSTSAAQSGRCFAWDGQEIAP